MELFGKLRNYLRVNRLTANYKTRQDAKDDRAFYDEDIRPGRKMWFFLLFVSSAVIISKYLGDYSISIPAVCEHLLSVNNIFHSCYNSVLKILIYIWTLLCKFQWIVFPSFFATAFVVFSWSVLYMDSDIPGVNPPTPFSSSRYRNYCARSMDFSYALTGTFGFLIFVRLLYQNLRYAD